MRKVVVLKRKCQLCGKPIPLGVTRYEVSISIQSGFDGFLPVCDEEEEQINETLGQLEGISGQEAEEDIHLEIQVILCRSCRNRFAQEIKELLNQSPSKQGSRKQIVQ